MSRAALGLAVQANKRIDAIVGAEERAVYGVSWTKVASPALTRTDAAVGRVANAGVGGTRPQNDFDAAGIYRDIHDVTDTLGNEFVRIPKFYIEKIDLPNFKSWRVSKIRYPGFYLPWCFWDFTNNRELPYVDVGKYKGSSELIGGTTRLRSVPNVYPTVGQNIVTFRTWAQNNNVGGLNGYQQLDVHVVDLLQALFYAEFATIHSQSIMQGYTTGRYNVADVAVAATSPAGNAIVVSNATGAHYRVGQAISVGTTLGGHQRFYARNITAITVDTPIAGQTTIAFDGAPVVLAVNDILYNTGWRNGFSRGSIAASSGSLTANDGRFPCVYRGIESLYGDCWQFVDGVNINNHQTWVCKNAANYASNLFASPYEQLSYVNSAADGWVTVTGHDVSNPYAELPTVVGGSSTTFYSDHYWQTAAQHIAVLGGTWDGGAAAGLSYWGLNDTTASTSVGINARLVKKAL